MYYGIKRSPAIYAYSLVKLKELNTISGLETLIKVLLILILFPKIGLLAPLIARIALAIMGFSYQYWKLGKNIITQT